MSGKGKKGSRRMWEAALEMADNAFVFSDNIDDWLRVGSFVAQRRSELGMTQGEAAELASVSESFWTLLERGRKQRVRRMNVPGIERTLGWSLGSFERLLIDALEPELIAGAAEELSDSYDVTELRRDMMEMKKRVQRLEDIVVDLVETLRSVPKL